MPWSENKFNLLMFETNTNLSVGSLDKSIIISETFRVSLRQVQVKIFLLRNFLLIEIIVLTSADIKTEKNINFKYCAFSTKALFITQKEVQNLCYLSMISSDAI